MCSVSVATVHDTIQSLSELRRTAEIRRQNELTKKERLTTKTCLGDGPACLHHLRSARGLSRSYGSNIQLTCVYRLVPSRALYLFEGLWVINNSLNSLRVPIYREFEHFRAWEPCYVQQFRVNLDYCNCRLLYTGKNAWFLPRVVR